jgi:hypothetical protein
LAAQPNYRIALRIKIISCVYLGRNDEARDWLGRLLELDPGLTIARLKARVPQVSSVFLGRYDDALREAGLPEE